MSNVNDHEDYCVNTFAVVQSQFDTAHKKKRHIVSTEEIKRRMQSPERLPVTKLEQIIRVGKSAGGL